MQFYKLKFLNGKLKRLQDEIIEINADIDLIVRLGGRPTATKEKKEKLIKKIEEVNKVKMQIEDNINSIDSEIDKEIMMRRYKGQTYEKISIDLGMTIDSVKWAIRKFYKTEYNKTNQNKLKGEL